jgi:hypothetical protein
MRPVFRTVVVASLIGGLVLAANRPARADEARTIIEKAVKAHGGEEFLSKHKAGQLKGKGKLELLGGVEFTQEASFMLPDRIKEVVEMEVNGQKVRVVTAFIGDKGFIQANGMDVPLNDDIKTALKEVGYVMKVGRLAPLLKEKGFELSLLGEVKVENKPTVGVLVTCKGHKDVSLFFDKETSLLAKVEARRVDPMSGQEVTEERIITEYQKQNGVPVPKKVLINRDGKKFMEMEVVEVKYLDKLDDSEFTKP